MLRKTLSVYVLGCAIVSSKIKNEYYFYPQLEYYVSNNWTTNVLCHDPIMRAVRSKLDKPSVEHTECSVLATLSNDIITHLFNNPDDLTEQPQQNNSKEHKDSYAYHQNGELPLNYYKALRLVTSHIMKNHGIITADDYFTGPHGHTLFRKYFCEVVPKLDNESYCRAFAGYQQHTACVDELKHRYDYISYLRNLIINTKSDASDDKTPPEKLFRPFMTILKLWNRIRLHKMLRHYYSKPDEYSCVFDLPDSVNYATSIRADVNPYLTIGSLSSLGTISFIEPYKNTNIPQIYILAMDSRKTDTVSLIFNEDYSDFVLRFAMNNSLSPFLTRFGPFPEISTGNTLFLQGILPALEILLSHKTRIDKINIYASTEFHTTNAQVVAVYLTHLLPSIKITLITDSYGNYGKESLRESHEYVRRFNSIKLVHIKDNISGLFDLFNCPLTQSCTERYNPNRTAYKGEMIFAFSKLPGNPEVVEN